MRRRRAIVFDDEKLILYLLNYVLSAMNFEVLTFSSPVACPLYAGSDACTKDHPCADVMITDFHMPGMTGMELIKKQAASGCKLSTHNKAVMSGHVDDAIKHELQEMGCTYFEKPLELDELTTWLAQCENRIPLTQPLASRRSYERYHYQRDIQCIVDHAGSETVLCGMTINISDTGICLRLPAVLESGQRVRFRSYDPPSARNTYDRTPLSSMGIPLIDRTASVSWVNHQGNGSYLAGLRFA